MPDPVPFIGREEELTLIEGLIRKQLPTCDAVFLHGQGGVGKTRLLYEVAERFGRITESHLLITRIMDFGKPALHKLDGMRQAILEELGRERFSAYLQALSNWRKIARAGVTDEKLEQEKHFLANSFAKNFNAVSQDQKIIVLVDTVDAVPSEVESLSLVHGLQNVLWLFAGREAKSLAENLLPQAWFDQTYVRNLPFFDPEESQDYLFKKQAAFHTTIEGSLASKVLFLAGGKPILIDLAVEWMVHNIPLDWLVKQNYEELIHLPENELEARRAEFQRHLVYRIIERRTKLDSLFIVLTKVYPLDVQGIVEFLGCSLEEAKALMQEALTFSFIKKVRDSYILLHDEMQCMLDKYVWEELDPRGARLKRYSQQAEQYFGAQAAEIRLELEQILATESSSQEVPADHFWQREILEGRFWELARKQLDFANQDYPDKGADLFVTLFDFAASSLNLQTRQNLLDEMSPYIGALSLSRKYEFEIRQARHLGLQGDYPNKKASLLELLRTEALSSKQKVEALLELGNTLIRMADFKGGVAYLGQAVQMSRREKLHQFLANAMNTLGWGYRLMGNLDNALDCYQEALSVAADSADTPNQALILNNMGYIYALRRNINAALEACHQALAIWMQLDCKGNQVCERDRRRNIGTVYGTIATILPEFGQFTESLSYRQKAMNIFKPMEDLERLSNNYLSRGITYWLKGDIEAAQRDLEEARGIGLAYEQHRVLHYLAHIYRENGDFDEALKLFKKSYEISQHLPDPFYELNTLGDIVNLAVYQRQFSRWREFEKGFIAYKDKWDMVQYDLPEGLLFKNLGDLALGDLQLEKATDFYQHGLPLIASAGGYAYYTLTRQLQETETQFANSPILLSEVGRVLKVFWLEKGLGRSYPEALPLLARWAQYQQRGGNNE